MTRLQGTVVIVTLLVLGLHLMIIGLRLGTIDNHLKELIQVERAK